MRLAGGAVAACSLSSLRAAQAAPSNAVPLFDGKTLDGWIQIENNATLLAADGILDQPAFAAKLATGTDPISIFLRPKLEPLVRADLASFAPTNPNVRPLLSTLAKDINLVLSGPSIYDATRFAQVTLRNETADLLKQSPHGWQLARLNKLLLEDAYPAELAKSVTTGWIVKDGAMASNGVGRGIIYTAQDYTRFRLILTMRHLSGKPDHYACILLFCTRPQPGEMPFDALNGIQFGLPNGNHWDYRGGGSNLGDPYFTTVAKSQLNQASWSQIELLADAAKGTARMAVAQPPGSKAVEVLDFKDPTGGRTGPIALQIHNAGLFDEYKDIAIEVDPKEDTLITTQ